jgi:diguanylate cyclase (GGDEF)-like protein
MVLGIAPRDGAWNRAAKEITTSKKPAPRAGFCGDGARGTRTPDLLGAIQALSQLSYSPAKAVRGRISVRRGQPIVAGASPRWGVRHRLPLQGTPVSFRNRLSLFFLLLVIVPVLAVAAVGIVIVRNSESDRNDATIEQASSAAEGLYQDARARAEVVAQTVNTDDALARAVRDDDRAAQQRRLEDLAQRGGAERVVLTLNGEEPVEAGGGEAVAAVRSRVVDADGRPRGSMDVSVTTANDFAALLGSVTGDEVVLLRDGRPIAGTIEAGEAGIPATGDVDVGGDTYRVTGFDTPGFEDGTLGVRVLIPDDELQDAVSDNTLGLFLILAAFVICALAFALTAARSLRLQTTRLLEAATRIGEGDFSIEVPTEGKDEFAKLGEQFNAMARQLQGRLEELQQERQRLQETVMQVGDSLSKGLDRDAMLGIVVENAVRGVGADCGRVVITHGENGQPGEAARAGDVSSYMAVLEAGETAALRAGKAVETQLSGAMALSRPLPAPEPQDGMLGVISIARPGRTFSDREQELFAYLTSQAAISMENVDLHETVRRQAVTDELTGLFNHRRFQEVITAEVERTRRFGHELGLIMLDIDDFKRVNDTYGHLQGDMVLREVARVLKESSREIDEPARYGGEEMAVALPQTGLQGAYEFAERVRQRIEGLKLPLLEGDGSLRVTASFGAASLPHSAQLDKDALVAAADAALYRAKRSGKNRTVKAE